MTVKASPASRRVKFVRPQRAHIWPGAALVKPERALQKYGIQTGSVFFRGGGGHSVGAPYDLFHLSYAISGCTTAFPFACDLPKA